MKYSRLKLVPPSVNIRARGRHPRVLQLTQSKLLSAHFLFITNIKKPLSGARKWLDASVYVSVIRRLVVRLSFVLLTLTIQLLSACHYLAPTNATDWFTKGRVMCYHVYVIMH